MDEDKIIIDTSKLPPEEIQYFIDSLKRSPVLLRQFEQQVLRIAHWEKDDKGIYHCSNCMAKADYREKLQRNDYGFGQHLSNYCWNCGNRMKNDCK